MEQETKICLACGKIIYKNDNNSRGVNWSGRKYCSQKCSLAQQKKDRHWRDFPLGGHRA